MAPYADDPTLSLPTKLVSIAYPTMDILILAVVARAAASSHRREPALTLLFFGTVALLLTDALHGWQLLHGGYHTGGLLDGGWAAFYALLGAAALHPSVRLEPEDAPEPDGRLTRVAPGAAHVREPDRAADHRRARGCRRLARHRRADRRLGDHVRAGHRAHGRHRAAKRRGHQPGGRAARRAVPGRARAPCLPRRAHRPAQPRAVSQPRRACPGRAPPRAPARGRPVPRRRRLQERQRQPRTCRRRRGPRRGRSAPAGLHAPGRHDRTSGRRRVRDPRARRRKRAALDRDRPAGSQRAGGPDRAGGQGDHDRGQHRHRLQRPGHGLRPGRRGAAAQRRRCHVHSQGERQGRLPGLPARDARQGAGPPGAQDRPAASARRRRVHAALPADHGPAQGRHRRHGGAHPLGAPRARDRLAGRLRAAARGHRPDRAGRLPHPHGGLPLGRPHAARMPAQSAPVDGRQRVRLPAAAPRVHRRGAHRPSRERDPALRASRWS